MTASFRPPRRRIGVLSLVSLAHVLALTQFSLPVQTRWLPERQSGMVLIDLGQRTTTTQVEALTEAEPFALPLEIPDVDVPVPSFEFLTDPPVAIAGVEYTDAPQRPRPLTQEDECERVALQVRQAQRYDRVLFQRMEACRARSGLKRAT